MKQVKQANSANLSLMGKPKATSEHYRMMKYCVRQDVEEGILLFNVPTREMVLLSEEEFANAAQSEYLRSHWFFVPEDTGEKQAVDKLRWVLENMQKKDGKITGYTILTTTDCNARCFYCYELGRSRVPMSEEVAHKTAAFIREHCGGEKVGITWFGGEPLYNLSAIDTICKDLKNFGVEFSSKMVSNAYLFDDEAVRKATELWNLRSIQVSLDGTEDVYNKSKAFIYKEGSAYQIVLSNIGKLLDAGIQVRIRLNFDLYNAEDLLLLVDALAVRFRGKSNLSIYAHHLFEENKTMSEIHDDTAWTARYEALHRLEQRIEANGFSLPGTLKSKLKTNHCMADSDSCVTILPTGDIGVCEHHSEDEFIGHLDKEGFDKAVIASWKERAPEIPECADCPSYAECILLKKCTTNSQCFPQFREDKLRKLLKCMRDEYSAWKKGEKAEEEEDD